VEQNKSIGRQKIYTKVQKSIEHI